MQSVLTWKHEIRCTAVKMGHHWKETDVSICYFENFCIMVESMLIRGIPSH